jgi:hypothetical protein
MQGQAGSLVSLPSPRVAAARGEELTDDPGTGHPAFERKRQQRAGPRATEQVVGSRAKIHSRRYRRPQRVVENNWASSREKGGKAKGLTT